jgi:hypothetical protein
MKHVQRLGSGPMSCPIRAQTGLPPSVLPAQGVIARFPENRAIGGDGRRPRNPTTAASA